MMTLVEFEGAVDEEGKFWDADWAALYDWNGELVEEGHVNYMKNRVLHRLALEGLISWREATPEEELYCIENNKAMKELK